VQQAFTYQVPPEMEAEVEEGRRVVVPFGKSTTTGYVLSLTDTSDHPAPRPIAALADEPSLLVPYQVELARWIAAHYAAPLPEVVRAMIPPGVRSLKVGSRRKRGPKVESRDRALAGDLSAARAARALNGAQEAALRAVVEALDHPPRRLLLHGVTGSGKTEVYLAAIEHCLALGRSAIVLIPEVSLTPQLIGRFAERFAGDIAVLHSRLTPSEKAHEWRRLRAGEARVAVGPRAAVFAPLEDVGLIVVDEEHSTTYKQNRVPRYHAGAVAERISDLAGAVVLAGSATPSVVSYYRHGRAEGEHLGAAILELPERFGGDPLPAVEVVDMRADEGWSLARPVGARLAELGEAELARGGQVILYLNRRGLAWYARCRRCGESVGCPNCSVSLVYHGTTKRLSCHYCGHSEEMPRLCPNCGARQVTTVGFGTERIEAEARRLFPSARVLRLDRDTVRARDSYFAMWEAFVRGDADVLVGTSLVAKGWDLRRVGLVGVIDADQALHYPDYRAAEEAFATLVQVSGRARRETSRVVVQTMNPHHYAIRLGVAQDYHGFVAEELQVREALGFPPFTRLVDITAYASEDARARAMAERYAEGLRDNLIDQEVTGISLLGPSPAFIHRLRGEYRWSMTLKGVDLEPALRLLPQARGFTIDVDPM